MSSESTNQPDRLAEALVAAFPRYIGRRLAELGVVAGGVVSGAVVTGTNQLISSLGELLAAAASEQPNSPLELVRGATIPISVVLAEMGVRPVQRDGWEVAAHGEDLFDLYPASSHDLGEEAWQLHLQWGINKAQVVAGVIPAEDAVAPRMPNVGLFGIAPGHRPRLVAALTALGYEALVWRNPAGLAAASPASTQLVVVDLQHRLAHDAIRQLVASGIRTVAATERLDDLVMPALLALGVEDVIELGGLVDRLDSLLPRLV